MSELIQLETRIAAAFDRIKDGLDAMAVDQSVPAFGADFEEAAPPPFARADETNSAEYTDALNAQVEEVTGLLNEERAVNAQLQERVVRLKERQDGKLAELAANMEAGRGRAARMDRELQRLRQVNAQLRDINGQLRNAVSDGVSEPHLINTAMLIELEALRATRAADAAEMDAILQELTPIIEQEAADATG